MKNTSIPTMLWFFINWRFFFLTKYVSQASETDAVLKWIENYNELSVRRLFRKHLMLRGNMVSVWIHTCEYVCVHMCVNMGMCVYAFTGLCVHVCALQACMCVCVCMFMCATVHMCDFGSVCLFFHLSKHSLIYLTEQLAFHDSNFFLLIFLKMETTNISLALNEIGFTCPASSRGISLLSWNFVPGIHGPKWPFQPFSFSPFPNPSRTELLTLPIAHHMH